MFKLTTKLTFKPDEFGVSRSCYNKIINVDCRHDDRIFFFSINQEWHLSNHNTRVSISLDETQLKHSRFQSLISRIDCCKIPVQIPQNLYSLSCFYPVDYFFKIAETNKCLYLRQSKSKHKCNLKGPQFPVLSISHWCKIHHWCIWFKLVDICSHLWPIKNHLASKQVISPKWLCLHFSMVCNGKASFPEATAPS